MSFMRNDEAQRHGFPAPPPGKKAAILDKDNILEWFINGRVGISSRAMAAAAVGIPCTKYFGDNHPCDPADFNRCLLLLEKAPEIRQSFDKVAALSPVWAALVARWDEIEQCLLDEVGLNWSKGRQLPAERTYDLMRSIIDPAEHSQQLTGDTE